MNDKLWSMGTTATVLVGGIVAKKAGEGIWKKATNSHVPDDPEDPGVDWGRAIVYAALSGALIQLLRMVINRQSTRTYIKATGHHPNANAR